MDHQKLNLLFLVFMIASTPGLLIKCNVPGFTYAPAFNLAALSYPIPSSDSTIWDSQTSYPRIVGDINGDGKPDIVGFGYAYTYVALGCGAGFSVPLPWSSIISYSHTWTSTNAHPRYIKDRNGDGLKDIMSFSSENIFSLSSNFGSLDDSPFFAQSFNYGSNHGYFQNERPRMIADVNGDKLADIVIFDNSATIVQLGDGSQFLGPVNWINDFCYDHSWTSQELWPIYLADINGDGKDDIVGFHDSGLYASLSTGTNFDQPFLALPSEFSNSNQGWIQSLYPRFTGDFNGDGKADIIGFKDNVYVSLSTGDSFSPSTIWSTINLNSGAYGPSDLAPKAIADVNCDGKDDIIVFTSDGSGVKVFLSGDSTQSYCANPTCILCSPNNSTCKLCQNLPIYNWNGYCECPKGSSYNPSTTCKSTLTYTTLTISSTGCNIVLTAGLPPLEASFYSALNFGWSVTSTSSNTSLTDSLKNYLLSLSSSIITIPSDYLEPAIDYTFIVSRYLIEGTIVSNTTSVTTSFYPVCNSLQTLSCSSNFNWQCLYCSGTIPCKSSSTPNCDLATNLCFECVTDSHCPDPLLSNCLNRTCTQCTSDSQCNPGKICYNGACVQCFQNSHCSSLGSTPTCKISTNQCVGCLADADCTVNPPICNSTTNTCPICNTISNNCFECLTDSHCTNPLYSRCTSSKMCVECLSNADCSPNKECGSNNRCTGKTIYINPSSSCSSGCTGLSSNPFNSLWAALTDTPIITNKTFILLNSGANNHFNFIKETAKNYSVSVYITTSVIIRPLFCDEPDVALDSNLAGLCITRDRRITVYLKDERLNFIVQNSLTIQNIIFDWSEAIQNYNLASSANFQSCILNRLRCCTGSIVSSLYSDVYCYKLNQNNGDSITSDGFINLYNVSKSNLEISYTTFQYFYPTDKVSLIYLNEAANVKIEEISVFNTRLTRGIIAGNPNFTASPLIKMSNVTILNWNQYNVKYTGAIEMRAILIDFRDISHGVVEITNLVASNCLMEQSTSLININAGASQLIMNDTVIFGATGMKITLLKVSGDSTGTFSANSFIVRNSSFFSSEIIILTSFYFLNFENFLFEANILDLTTLLEIHGINQGLVNNLTLISNTFTGQYAYDIFSFTLLQINLSNLKVISNTFLTNEVTISRIISSGGFNNFLFSSNQFFGKLTGFHLNSVFDIIQINQIYLSNNTINYSNGESNFMMVASGSANLQNLTLSNNIILPLASDSASNLCLCNFKGGVSHLKHLVLLKNYYSAQLIHYGSLLDLSTTYLHIDGNYFQSRTLFTSAYLTGIFHFAHVGINNNTFERMDFIYFVNENTVFASNITVQNNIFKAPISQQSFLFNIKYFGCHDVFLNRNEFIGGARILAAVGGNFTIQNFHINNNYFESFYPLDPLPSIYTIFYEKISIIQGFYVKNNIFVGNSIFMDAYQSSYLIKNLEIHNNTIDGWLILRSQFLTFTYSLEVKANHITNGGYIFEILDGIAQLYNTSVYHNLVEDENTNIFLITVGQFDVNDGISFINNTILNKASLIISTFNSTYQNLIFRDNIFNSTNGKCSAFYLVLQSNSPNTILDSIFEGNILYQDSSLFFNQAESSFVFKNVSFIKNQVYGTSRMIFLPYYGNFFIKDSHLIGNILNEYGSIIEASIHSFLNISNNNFQQNSLNENALLITINTQGVLAMSQCTFTNNLKMQTTANKSIIQATEQVFISITDSEFNLTNITFQSVSSIMFVSDSNGNMNNITISNLQSSPKRNLLFFYSSIIQLDGIEIFESLKNEGEDSWFNFIGSTIHITNISLNSIRARSGNIFKAIQTTLYITSLRSQDSYFDSKSSIFSSIKGYLFINNARIRNANGFLLSDQDKRITINLVDYQSTNTSSTIITARNGDSLTFKNVNITNQNTNLRVPSLISLSEMSGSISIQSISISNGITTSGSIDLKQISMTAQFFFKNCIFSNNSAYQGGAISINKALSSNFTFENCAFLNNKAIGNDKIQARGGALYLGTHNSATQRPNFIIKASSFLNNTAELNGDAIFIDGVEAKIMPDCTFSNKRPSRDQYVIASQAVKLKNLKEHIDQDFSLAFYLNPNLVYNSNFFLMDVGSSAQWKQDLSFVLLDMFDQRIFYDSTSTLRISISDNTNITTSTNSIKANRGILNLSSVIFSYKPGLIGVAPFIASGITYYPQLQMVPAGDFSRINVTMYFRNCTFGEILLDSGACYYCPENFYSLDFIVNSKKPCKKGDFTVSKSLGGVEVGPINGAWRMNSTSDLFLSCPLSQACLSGEQNGTLSQVGSCAKGYQGNLCNTCQEGYGKNKEFCLACSDLWDHYLIMIVVLAINFSLVINTIGTALEEIEKPLSPKEIELKELEMNLMKNLINTIQLVSLIGSFNVPWDLGYQLTLFSGAQEVMRPSLFSAGCIKRDLASPLGISDFYVERMTTLLQNFFYYLMVPVIWALIFAYKKRKIKGNSIFWDNIIASWVVISFNYQTDIVLASTDFFKCKNLYRTDSPIEFLMKDYDTQCWTQDHYLWIMLIAVPMIFIWVFFFPITTSISMARNRKKIMVVEMKRKYGFLYKGYKIEHFYWEFLIMIRKFALILISTIGTFYSPAFQIYFSCFIIWGSVVLQLRNNPYWDSRVNTTEFLSLIALASLCNAGLYFSFVPSSEINLVFAIISVAGVVPYGYYWAKCYWLVLREKPPVKKIIEYLKSRSAKVKPM